MVRVSTLSVFVFLRLRLFCKDLFGENSYCVFDKKRHRIGYGGGFYDRYLEQHPQMQTLAVCFEEQVMEEVPFALHDIRPAIIVTDQKCYE